MEFGCDVLHGVYDQFGDARFQSIAHEQKGWTVHGGLGEEHGLAVQLNVFEGFVDGLDHDAFVADNAADAEDFRVVFLSEDHNLIALVPELAHALLEFCHYRTRSIDDLDAAFPCFAIRGRGLSMRTDDHLCSGMCQTVKIIHGDGF